MEGENRPNLERQFAVRAGYTGNVKLYPTDLALYNLLRSFLNRSRALIPHSWLLFA